jgi:hypothetical protein
VIGSAWVPGRVEVIVRGDVLDHEKRRPRAKEGSQVSWRASILESML